MIVPLSVVLLRRVGTVHQRLDLILTLSVVLNHALGVQLEWELYLSRNTDDDRLSTALNETTTNRSELSELKERLAGLEAQIISEK